MGGELLEIRSPDGTRLGVEREGSGPALLAVHGGTADRTRWAPVREELAKEFTLYLLDRRGRGASRQEAEGPYSLWLEVQDVAAVADSIGEPVLLLGHSYGALIGMEALLATDAWSRALLYEPVFDTPGQPIAPPGSVDRMSDLLARDDREGALELFYREIIGIDPTPLRALPVWQARLAAVHTVEREGRIGLDYACEPHRFADLRLPIRVLVGTDSPASFRAAALAAHRALPGSELVELPGQGHTMIDADPPGFVAQVVDFLGSPQAGPR